MSERWDCRYQRHWLDHVWKIMVCLTCMVLMVVHIYGHFILMEKLEAGLRTSALATIFTTNVDDIKAALEENRREIDGLLPKNQRSK